MKSDLAKGKARFTPAGSPHIFQEMVGYVLLMILTPHLTNTSMGDFFAAIFYLFR
jgi:hypothetical protein